MDKSVTKMLKRHIINATTTIDKVGEKEDYIHLPIIKDGVAIGVINDCFELDGKYIFDLVIWQKFSLETTNDKPSALLII